MDRIERRNIDRSGWAHGPWTDEPDLVVWTDETGLPCIVVRTPHVGHLCGYVGYPSGIVENREVGPEVTVHGGITYVSAAPPSRHNLPTGLPPIFGEYTWIGFDCGHYNDLSPGVMKSPLDDMTPEFTRPYRTLAYVTAEVESLARQIFQLKSPLFWLVRGQK